MISRFKTLLVLWIRADGHMDGIHAIRERTRADISRINAIKNVEGLCIRKDRSFENDANAGRFAFAVSGHIHTHLSMKLVTLWVLGMIVMRVGCEDSTCFSAFPYAYGYVNLRGLVPGAPESARWKTIMAYNTLCEGCRRN